LIDPCILLGKFAICRQIVAGIAWHFSLPFYIKKQNDQATFETFTMSSDKVKTKLEENVDCKEKIDLTVEETSQEAAQTSNALDEKTETTTENKDVPPQEGDVEKEGSSSGKFFSSIF
jgi:hypothetical protein